MTILRPVIHLGSRRVAVDAPHLAFATGIAAWSCWFCWDAWSSGPNIENLIMIVPAAAAMVVLYIFVAAGCFHAAGGEGTPVVPVRPTLAPGIGVKVAGTMAMLAGLVVAGPLVGFDVAGFAYIVAMLLFLGERRILVLVLVPVIFCAAAIYGFNRILAIPLPLLFFSGEPA